MTPPVEDVLKEICAALRDVRGAVVATRRGVYAHLPRGMRRVNPDTLAMHATTMFRVTTALDDYAMPFGSMFLEFEGLSVFAMDLHETTILLITDQADRREFEATEQELHAFLPALSDALIAVEGEDQPPLVAPVVALDSRRPEAD